MQDQEWNFQELQRQLDIIAKSKMDMKELKTIKNNENIW